MLKGLAEYISLGLISLRPKKEVVHRDIYGREVEHADDFFHPQKFRGIPVFDAESILIHYKPQLERLRDVVDIGDHRKTPGGKPLFDELFLNVIKRFITFVHMIPASEDHHHSNTGGLLTHSIEASIEALRWSKELKCQVTHMPDLDAQIKPIIDYSSWLGGLLHDVGKIMRDISVDAVEVIHPFTKRPVPMTSPILSWHPQKQSLTEWAKGYNISAYSVTWLRHRTHNRHNIDSGQILQPLLHGTYALDYLLSSPVKQEIYSELVRCLSGYTHQKGHVSDCMRMGDSVSTNRALSIQYDPVRGHRRVSTATKLYHCINHARKEWEWNRTKAQGWIIGAEAYIRWTSAIDAIIGASIDRQYGLPTDTRNILTIMESNGFTHLFDPESPNDRILKFCPGNFNDAQKSDIVSGKKPVTWIDLIKMVTPHVVFGENPVPPSMTGIIYLPNAKLFYYINKDGDIQPLNPTAELPSGQQDIISEQPAAIAQLHTPSQPATAEGSNTSKTKPKKAAAPAVEQSTPKPTKQKNTDVPALPPMLPKAASKSSSLNSELFGDTPVSNSESNASTSNSNNDEAASQLEVSKTELQYELSINDCPDEISHSNMEVSQTDAEQPTQSNSDNKDSPEPSIAIPKGITLSDTFRAVLDKKVVLYKTERAVLIDANDAEVKLGSPLSEILKSLKSANELLVNPMTPALLTTFHVFDGQKVKCISLAYQLTRIFTHLPVGQHNASVMDSTTAETSNKDNANNEKSVPEGKVSKTSIKETDSITDPVHNGKSSQTSIEDAANSEHDKPADETSFIPAALPNPEPITEDMLRAFITPKTANRYDGHIYINIDILCQSFAITDKQAHSQLLSIKALHVTPVDPEPVFKTRKRHGKPVVFAKLANIYDDALPNRAPVSKAGSNKADEAPKKEEPKAQSEQDYSLSLTNLAEGASINTLISFLEAKKAKGLLTYLDNGKIAIELSAIPSSSYRPHSKAKIMHYLLSHGGEKQGTHIHISVDDLLRINLEDM
ncbi:MAG: hypothetical protein CML22_07395 [Rheinheimera sp.]|nr:hypothetical protein [Rheinheimera sp.]MBM34108.1 hypothetical protein [Rheinheimera sp.]|tara:strand:+ start:22810 stop:25839 length:3030 start_codon:yes stop_codon:yes gene_type:complete